MEISKYCPNCGFASEIKFSECPKCGIILKKLSIVKKIEAKLANEQNEHIKNEKTSDVSKEKNDHDIIRKLRLCPDKESISPMEIRSRSKQIWKIKKNENADEQNEKDRIRHLEVRLAQTENQLAQLKLNSQLQQKKFKISLSKPAFAIPICILLFFFIWLVNCIDEKSNESKSTNYSIYPMTSYSSYGGGSVDLGDEMMKREKQRQIEQKIIENEMSSKGYTKKYGKMWVKPNVPMGWVHGSNGQLEYKELK